LLCFDRALDYGCYAWVGSREQLGLIGLQCLDRQLELLGLMRQLLRRTPELRPAIASELEAQLGDLGLSRDRILRHRRDDLLQRLRVVRQLIGRERHSLIESHRPPFDAAEARADSLCRSQPASIGCEVRNGRRQSMPSSSIDSCAGVSTASPCSARGHTKRPRSSLLANRHSPSPSHHNSFTRSPRRPRKQKTWPENGSLPSTVCACTAKLSKPSACRSRPLPARSASPPASPSSQQLDHLPQ